MRVDPRLSRTRTSLRDALRALLAEHRFDDISVTALCKAAGVHRTTFYGHARTVHQFAIEEFSGDIERIATVPVHADEESPAHVAGRYASSFEEILRVIARDRTVYRALFESDSRGAFRSALEARVRPHARRAIDVFAAQDVVGAPFAPPQREEAAAFIAGAIVGTIDVWTMSDEVDVSGMRARVIALMPPWWPSP